MSSPLLITGRNEPRKSSETDQRYLLSDSVAASETSSIITDLDRDGERTPRAHSPTSSYRVPLSATRHQSIAAPEQAHVQGPYRGFASEQAYLDALRAWAEGRKYEQPTNTSLVGFYGTTTMAEYASRPPALQPLGLRKKWKAMKANRQEGRQKKLGERRATVA